MFLVTIDPAPIIDPEIMDTGNKVTLDPITTLFPILVFLKEEGFLEILPFYKSSLVNITPCPTKQFFPISTFSHIKLWLWILVLSAILVFF